MSGFAKKHMSIFDLIPPNVFIGNNQRLPKLLVDCSSPW